jgi:hypothetical protein
MTKNDRPQRNAIVGRGSAMVQLEGVSSVVDVARVQALRRGGETALVFEGRAITFAGWTRWRRASPTR